jgi:short-subunit dehydrogenase/folate-dependent phosphoribosylglycinamide formyltransferase PurN
MQKKSETQPELHSAPGQGKKRILILCGNEAPGINAANVYAEKLAGHELCFLEEKVLSLGRILRFTRRRLKTQGIFSLLGSYLYFLPQCFAVHKKPEKKYKADIVTNDFSTDPKIAEFLKIFNPDIVLVAFCGILSKDFLRLLPTVAYNIHPGINPRYRGFGNVWAFYESNYCCIGYTIHEVDEGTDTGRRVVARRLDPVRAFSGVAFADIDAHVLGLAAAHLADILLGLQETEYIPAELHELTSVLYGAPTLKVYLAARRNFRRLFNPLHIFISGASSGLGRALACAFAAPGRRLSLLGRNLERLDETAELCRRKGAESTLLLQDIRELEPCRKLLENLDAEQPIDLAILAAGVSSGTLPDGKPERVEDACRTLECNALATVNCAGALFNCMSKRLSAGARAQVVFISSLAALRPLPDSPAYGASKMAVAYYAKAARPLYKNLRISLVYPGYVDTPMSRRVAGPQPLRVSADDAALLIRDRLEKGSDNIVFPRLLALGLNLLRLLPCPLAQFFLKRFAFTIAPDIDPGKETH